MQLRKPPFDERIFEAENNKTLFKLTYTSSEMSYIISDYLDYFTSDYPVCKQIRKLLQNTIRFRIETTPPEKYKREHKQEISFSELEKKSPFIHQAETDLQQLPPNSMEYRLFSSAIRYCKESIRRRFEELNE